MTVLGLVALLYWPASHGGFVWDDHASLHDNAGLRGDSWKHLVFRGFNGWVNYFRPLVVLLFVAQTHAFNVAPGPMHIVSIGLHLANMVLVGLLAAQWLAHRQLRPWATVGAMLFYGLHPALIEPVDWIGCQFELGLVFFVLLGLLLNSRLQAAGWRSIAVGLCFLFAAGFKEAAIAFPALLLILDLAADQSPTWAARLRTTWQKQRWVYVGVIVAGSVYLTLRFWALGYAVLPSGSESLLSLVRFQRVCLTYLSYWKLIFWPMTGIGLIHDVDETLFSRVSLSSLAADAAATGIVIFGLIAFLQKRTIGTLIIAVSAALIPVLNLVPVAFNEGLYHDRYAATAIAMACVLTPRVLASALAARRVMRVAAVLAGVLWVGFAVADLRTFVPIWADELTLWQWTAQKEPRSITARSQLLTIYLSRNDHVHARELADAMVANDASCVTCMLNAANLAIADADAARAALALDKVKNAEVLAYNRGLLQAYILTNGQLLEMQNAISSAADAYRDAATLDPLDPLPRMLLAMLQVRHGDLEQAQQAADTAFAMFAPDTRERWRARFAQARAARQTH